MKKLTFDKLVVELTRSCNMNPPCKHCLRGKAENIDIDKSDIDRLLDQTEIIGSLFFTGGEPTLKIDLMQYFIDELYKRKIPLFDFGFITNGLLYNETIIDIIKQYSRLVKLCNETGSNRFIDVEKYIVIGVSIDKYHNNNDLAEQNLKKYKNALKGYAQVVRIAEGNTPRFEGNACCFLSDGLSCNDHLTQALYKRVEILDKEHKPICPHYATYKLIKPEQVVICCDMYLNVKGNIMLAAFGLHEYATADNKYGAGIICTTKDDIYNSILEYNKYGTDCLTLLKNTISENKKHPLKGLHDALFYLQHKDEDNSDRIIKDRPFNIISLDKINEQAAIDTTYIDDIIRRTQKHSY